MECMTQKCIRCDVDIKNEPDCDGLCYNCFIEGLELNLPGFQEFIRRENAAGK